MSAVSPDALYLKQMELGPMQNFVYLLGDSASRECVVVDPAWEIDAIVDTAAADGMRLVGALVTHTHQDHVGGSLEAWGMPGRIPGVEELLGRVPLRVYVHRAEREFLKGLGSDLVQVADQDTGPRRERQVGQGGRVGHQPEIANHPVALDRLTLVQGVERQQAGRQAQAGLHPGLERA